MLHLFLPIYFQYTSLYLKWVSCRQHIVVSYLFFHSGHLCLLTRMFSPRFNVIIGLVGYFSTDWGAIVQEVMRAMGGGRWSFARSPAADLLLCGPVPNRLHTDTGPRPRGWGPPRYTTVAKCIISISIINPTRQCYNFCFRKLHVIFLIKKKNRFLYLPKYLLFLMPLIHSWISDFPTCIISLQLKNFLQHFL